MSDDTFHPIRVVPPARIYRLGDEPPDDLSAVTTAAERIEMVAVLTRRAWELTGKPWPTVPRAQWPVKVIARRDAGPRRLDRTDA